MLIPQELKPISKAIYESIVIYRNMIAEYGLNHKATKAYSGALNHVIRQYDGFTGARLITKEAVKQIRVENPFGLGWTFREKVNAYYEHCNPIKEIKEGLLKCNSLEEAEEYLFKNIIVCWMTEEENNKLNKAGYRSKRPNGFIECYNSLNIEILNETEFKKLKQCNLI